MKRKAENFIKEWIHSYHRKPLIIRGARQVGKSTMVRNFAASNKYDLVEINLEKDKGDFWMKVFHARNREAAKAIR